MPISVSIHGLSWLTPDTKPLFTDLNLFFGPERAGIVGRNGTGKSTLLRLIAGELQPAAGQVRVSATIAMMRQDAMVHADTTIADLFQTRDALALLNRAYAGLAHADELAEADWTLPARMDDALSRFGLQADPQTPLATLSGGQRNRTALAALIFAEPDFLLLDEPTNNLDQEGRDAVIGLIRGWRRGAIIVSHDRALLEEMDAIVELTSLGANRYGGNYSAFRQQKDRALNAAEQDFLHAQKTASEARRRTQQATERKARKDSTGKKARRKGGQPKILMDAAKDRAEASGGVAARLRDARREVAEETLTASREKIEILQPLRMDIAPTGLPPGKPVLRLDNVHGGYGHDRAIIHNLSLAITGPERILVTGANGSGKTTLLKLIAGHHRPESGKVEMQVSFAMLDQQTALLHPGSSLLENFRRLNPSENDHKAHAALARFGFRAADALCKAAELSGGERLRAGLACVLGAEPPPMLLILDEPTNHLDLDGIEALEAALAGYDGAILAVSHDPSFIKALAPDRTVHLER